LKYENSAQISVHILKNAWDLRTMSFRLCLGKLQENIQDWLQLDEEDPGFQLPASSKFLDKDSTEIFLFIFISTTYTCYYISHFFSNLFILALYGYFCFINPDYISFQLD
jgi:hypothetical protein